MISPRIANTSWILIAILALAGCSQRRAAEGPVPAGQAFAEVIEAADSLVSNGNHAAADRVLSEFALKQQGTEEATEVAFWRALYMVDPANKRTSISEGIRALDIYLETPGTRWYRAQAEVLRRTAQSVQALRSAAQAQPRIVGRDTVFVSREEEIASLRDQLARANAELDRIRRRLANPTRPVTQP
ncbi:MAG: hypothetical protein ACR2GK_05765 [Gemmatimonadaceae bacterium]